MTSQSASNKTRPLSPHLQVYKPQISSAMSIFHRITGVGLSLGLPVFVTWLVVLAAGPNLYIKFADLFQTAFGQILLFGWTWAFFYHFCCGIRHLLWDAGYFLDIKGMRISGWTALTVSSLLTAVIWMKTYGYIP